MDVLMNTEQLPDMILEHIDDSQNPKAVIEDENDVMIGTQELRETQTQLRSNENNLAIQYQQSMLDAQRNAEMHLQQSWSSQAKTHQYEEMAAQVGQRAMTEIYEMDKT